MRLGMIGLGRMGGNMVTRLLQGGHQVVVYTRDQTKVQAAVAHGAEGATSRVDLAGRLSPPRAVWIMLPEGGPTQAAIDELAPVLSKGDVIVDGGNSRYTDSIRRAQELAPKGIHFMDAGTSGGVWGLKVGYCLMVGGPEEAFRILEPALKTLAPPDGYLHCGSHGSGHFVKMVHNGIEYGMMQAYAEGFEIMKASPFGLDLPKIANLWMQGSVVRSWLLELGARALEQDPNLEGLRGYVEDSGEGRWTVMEAIDRSVPAPIITLSLMRRFASRQQDSFANKMLAALRQQFGGHAVKKE